MGPDFFSHSEQAACAEKVGGNRHPEDAKRKQTAADRRAWELDPSECRETEAGKVKMADRETVQRGGAGVGGVADAARALRRLESGVVLGAGRWKGKGSGRIRECGAASVAWSCCRRRIARRPGQHVGVEGDAGLSSRRLAARLGLGLESEAGSGSVLARELRRPGRGGEGGEARPRKIRRDGSGEEVSREGRAPSLTGRERGMRSGRCGDTEEEKRARERRGLSRLSPAGRRRVAGGRRRFDSTPSGLSVYAGYVPHGKRGRAHGPAPKITTRLLP